MFSVVGENKWLRVAFCHLILLTSFSIASSHLSQLNIFSHSWFDLSFASIFETKVILGFVFGVLKKKIFIWLHTGYFPKGRPYNISSKSYCNIHTSIQNEVLSDQSFLPAQSQKMYIGVFNFKVANVWIVLTGYKVFYIWNVQTLMTDSTPLCHLSNYGRVR